MKQTLLIIVGLFIWSQSASAEFNLSSTENIIDGFCVMDVLQLKSSKQVRFPKTRGKARVFLEASEKRAKAIYEGYAGESVNVKSNVVFEKRSDRGRTVFGSVVVVDAAGDEDVVTFYFINLDDKPLLKMALHDHQSAEAFWVCDEGF